MIGRSGPHDKVDKGSREAHGALFTIGRNLGWLLAGKGFGAVLSILYLGVATRVLGPSGFGLFAIILSLAQTVAGIVTFQTWRLIVLYGHSHRSNEDQSIDGVNEIVAFGLKLDILAALAGCLIAAVGIYFLAQPMGWTDTVAYVALAFAIVMLISVRSTAIGALRLYDQFGHGAMADAIMPLTRMIGAVLAAIYFPTVFGFLAAWAMSEITTAVAYWIATARHTPVNIFPRNSKTMREMIAIHPGIARFALVTNAGSTLQSVIQNLPLLTIGYLLSPAVAGLYRLANQLAQAMTRVADMLNRSIYPELARVISREGHTAAQHVVRRTSIIALIGSLFVLALTILAGKYMIKIIAGPEFIAAYPLLVILGAVSSIELAGVAFEPMLTASGKAVTVLLIRLAATLAMIASLAILMPDFGEIGAAFASLLTALLTLALSILSLRRKNRPEGSARRFGD